MSLVSQISAVITTIGGKLKDHDSRITTLENAAPSSPVIPADEVTATTYTLVAADAGREKQFPNGCAVTIDASVFDAGDVGLLRQTGSTAVSVVGASGTTVDSAGATAESAGSGALIVWRADSSDIVYLNGELAAS